MKIAPEWYEGINLRTGHETEQGQMSAEERQMIADAIIKIQPQIVVDVGTWKGLGSTYIAAAFVYRIWGTVYTYETDSSMVEIAKKNFKDNFPDLLDTVVFMNRGVDPNDFKDDSVGVAILDGQRTSDDYLKLRKSMGKRSAIFCHDWHDSKCVGVEDLLKCDGYILDKYDRSNTEHATLWVRK